MRDTLAALLGLEGDIEVVAQVDDADAIIPAAVAQRPDVAVVDIGLPGRDGPAAAADPAGAAPGVGVLILAVPGNRKPCAGRWPRGGGVLAEGDSGP